MNIHPVRLVLFVFILVLGSAFPGCYQPADASEYPDALILYPNAKDIWFGKVGLTDQLTYSVDAKFPASGVIGSISDGLAKKGWEPLTHDFLNPQLSSSQVRVWQDFLDWTGPTKLRVHQWLGDWQDKSGNIVRYAFRYAYSEHDPADLIHLRVAGIFISASVVRHLGEEVEKLRHDSRAGRAN
jgi:hypothetical protein